jgi:hypothetical protein
MTSKNINKYPDSNNRIQFFAVIVNRHIKTVRLVPTSDSKPIQCITKVPLMLASALDIMQVFFSNFNGRCATSLPTIRSGTLYTNYVKNNILLSTP